MSQEKVDLEIRLSGTWWNLPPSARVWLDDQILLDKEIRVPETIKWTGTLNEGPHFIKVDLHNKDYNRETILKDEKIIKDQLLNIDEILIDDIPMGFLLHQNSKYRTEDGRDVQRCINLGWNGQWSFEFNVPIYVWLLENF